MSRPALAAACARSTHRAVAGDDEGQVTLLVLGFVLLAVALITVVVAATGVHLDRKRLLDLSDLASLAAADSVTDDGYFTHGAAPGAREVPLSSEAVRAAVERYVRDHPDRFARWSQVQVLEAGTADGRTVVVRLGAVSRLALVGPLLAPWSDGVRIEATSTARAW